MFSKTYHRGEKMVVTHDMKNLAGFDNKMVSLKVSGDCCWTIFTDAAFGGEYENFSEGDYKSAVDLGKVLREGSSVIKGQKNHCHYS